MAFEAVLVPEAGRITPALVIEVKRQKLVLETVFGKRTTLAREKILHAEPVSAANLPDAIAHLKRLVEQAEVLKDEVDLELLWETFVDQGDEAYTLQDLAAAYFSDAVGLAQLKAVDLALGSRGEGEDFFLRAGARFRPHSRAHRTRLLQRRAEEAARQARFQEALERLASVLRDGGTTENLDEHASSALDQLCTFVRHGSGGGEAVAERLRPELETTGTPAGSSLREAGLAILIALGVWRRPSDVLVGKYRLKRVFQPAHLEAVETVRAAVEARTDLPDSEAALAFTVDDEGTQDYDDALSLRDEDGAWVLGVHIADPSPYIHRGSLLDDEAYGRGTTIYLPDQKYAMFPQALSEDLLSLRENQPRPVLSFYFRFATPDAEPDPPRLLKERLVVRHNLRYDEVDRMIEAGPAGLPGNEAPGDARAELALRVQQVARLAETFRAIRIAAGALSFHRPELKIVVDEEGEVHLTVLDAGSPAHRMVSEMMILVNRTGAEFLRDRGVPAIYRAQHPPREPVQLDETYDPVAFRREVRKMVKARLTLEPESHAGLGLSCYTQLSSPLRRYADLVMHRQLSHVLEGKPAPYPDREALLEVVVTSDMNYQTAVETERAARHAYALRYLEAHMGEVFTMIVVEPLAGRSDVLAEFASTALVGRLRFGAGAAPPAGTPVDARLVAVDVFQEEIVLDPIA